MLDKLASSIQSFSYHHHLPPKVCPLTMPSQKFHFTTATRRSYRGNIL